MPHKRAKRSVREAERRERGFNLAPTASSLKDDTPRSASRILNSWATQSSFKANGGRTSEDTGERPRKKARQSVSAGASSDTPAQGSSSKGKATAVGAGAGAGAGTQSGKEDEENGKGKGKAKGKGDTSKTGPQIPGIQPHESLGDYNRRVEDALRGGVAKAIKSASAIKADQARAERAAKEERKRKAKGLPPLADGDTGADADAEADGSTIKGKGKRKASDGYYLEPEDRPVVTFKPAPGPRRLNDIAQAPPSLPKLKGISGAGASAGGIAGAGAWNKGANAGGGKKGTIGHGRTDVINAGQKRLMEEERERVIRQYRDIKAAREQAKTG